MASAQPHPGPALRPIFPLPLARASLTVVVSGVGGEQTAGGHRVRATSPRPVERLQPSAFLLFCHLGAWGRASRHLGCLSVAVSCSRVCPSASDMPRARRSHLPHCGCSGLLPAEARINHRAGGTLPGIGVVTTHLTALEAEAPRA